MRSYGDGCSSAHALDLVGERWALLIVRDLLFGPKRFTDLHAGLPQGSPNVLTQRLRELEDAGVVRRRRLPPPASANGLRAHGVGRRARAHPAWASSDGAPARRPSRTTSRSGATPPCSPSRTPSSQQPGRSRRPSRSASPPARSPSGSPTTRSRSTAAPALQPDAVIETAPNTLEAIAFGVTPLVTAERAGDVRIDGDHDVAEQFFHRFPVPSPPYGRRYPALADADAYCRADEPDRHRHGGSARRRRRRRRDGDDEPTRSAQRHVGSDEPGVDAGACGSEVADDVGCVVLTGCGWRRSAPAET